MIVCVPICQPTNRIPKNFQPSTIRIVTLYVPSYIQLETTTIRISLQVLIFSSQAIPNEGIYFTAEHIRQKRSKLRSSKLSNRKAEFLSIPGFDIVRRRSKIPQVERNSKQNKKLETEQNNKSHRNSTAPGSEQREANSESNRNRTRLESKQHKS